jgi:hypothetical protein
VVLEGNEKVEPAILERDTGNLIFKKEVHA